MEKELTQQESISVGQAMNLAQNDMIHLNKDSTSEVNIIELRTRQTFWYNEIMEMRERIKKIKNEIKIEESGLKVGDMDIKVKL